MDYRCVVCSRYFVFKGFYRYYFSRCYFFLVKKYGIKEVFNMSFYIYFFLDYIVKFFKYYEMVQEFVNKGK